MFVSIILLILCIIVSTVFILLLINSKDYEQYIEPIDKKDFVLKEIYGVGFKILDIIKFDFTSKKANSLRQEATIIYGKKFAEYYLRVLYAQKISLTALCVVAACIFSCFNEGTNSLVMLVFGIVLSGIIYYYFSTNVSKQIQARSVKFMNEFPNAVSTVALLVNSGMVLREAWEEVSMSDDRELYLEMRKVNEDINNGISEADALYAFGNRCVTPEIKKFTSMIVQGLEKGNKDLAMTLKMQTSELWEQKKQRVLTQGELAANKLLFPIMIMFIGILIMVMGPIITNIGV